MADKDQAAQLAGGLVQLLFQSVQDFTEALHVETSQETKSNLYSRIDELRWKTSTAREMGALIKELAKKQYGTAVTSAYSESVSKRLAC